MIKNYLHYINESLNFKKVKSYEIKDLSNLNVDEIIDRLNQLFKNQYIMIEDVEGEYDSVIVLVDEFRSNTLVNVYDSICDLSAKEYTFNFDKFNMKNVTLDEIGGTMSITFRDVITKLESNPFIIKRVISDIDPYGEENWDDDENEITNEKIQYNKQLCQDIWDGNIMIDRIRKKLVKIAKDFFEDIEIDTEIIDIRLCGSMANYNYTEDSDIDVHIIIDFKDVNEDIELVKKAIDGQRFIWNLRHNIIIKNHDVELYIQNNEEEHSSSGLYSLLLDKWIKKPTYNPPDIDDNEVNSKYKSRVYDINKLAKMSKKNLSPDEAEKYYEMGRDLKSKIMKARKTGLYGEGEFSIENLVFKQLRTENYIEKLIKIITVLYDKIYSQ